MPISAFVDLVKIYIVNNDGAPFTLGAAAPPFRGSDILVDGQQYSYSVITDSDFEVGNGIFSSATNTLSRIVKASSRGGAAVSFPPGAYVSFTLSADDLEQIKGGLGSSLLDLLGEDTGAGLIGSSTGADLETRITALEGAAGGGARILQRVILPQTDFSTFTTTGIDLISGVVDKISDTSRMRWTLQVPMFCSVADAEFVGGFSVFGGLNNTGWRTSIPGRHDAAVASIYGVGVEHYIGDFSLAAGNSAWTVTVALIDTSPTFVDPLAESGAAKLFIDEYEPST